MSFDTKQILHIITEIIVVVSITIYFVNKNNQLLNHIEELEAKIKQQEEILQNHDNLILKIMNTVNMLSQQQYIQQPQVQQPQVQQPQVQQLPKTKQLPRNINSSKKVVVILPKKEEEKPKLSKIEEIIDEEDEEEEEEENLDDELLEELKDLEENNIVEHEVDDEEHI